MQVIYGHRGASAYAPENTLEAFEMAAQMGAAGVELDVHMTRDGELVVAHDEAVDRVAFGTGLIAEMTLPQLKKLRFNRTHPEFTKATIPTLREVYELLKPLGLCVNAELKNGRIDYPGLEEACIKLADEMGMTDRVLYSSFNHQSMARVKKIDPSIPCGLLYDCVLIEPWTYAGQISANALHPHFSEILLNKEEVAKCHALGMQVNVWTVNTEDELRQVIDAGADIIISNYPDRGVRIMEEKGR